MGRKSHNLFRVVYVFCEDPSGSQQYRDNAPLVLKGGKNKLVWIIKRRNIIFPWENNRIITLDPGERRRYHINAILVLSWYLYANKKVKLHDATREK